MVVERPASTFSRLCTDISIVGQVKLHKLSFLVSNSNLVTLSLIVPYLDACLRCQAENRSDKEQEECVVIWGECNHSFHNCCMKLWVSLFILV